MLLIKKNMSNTFPRMHVSLYVSDINKTKEFYSRLFNQEPVKIKTGYLKFVLENPSLIISFVENKDRVQNNFGHLGFQVETLEELNSKRTEVKLAGLQIEDELGVNCCYAR